MHSIAIITFHDTYLSHDDMETIVSSVSKWTKINDEEFMLLQKASEKFQDFKVIEQPQDIHEFIRDKIELYNTTVAAELLKAQKKKATLEKRKKTKEESDKQSKIEMLQKLQKELGINP